MRKSFVIHLLRSQEGMALLVTLMVVSLLTAITAHFGLSVRHEIVASTHAKDRNLIRAATVSGVHWGMAAIVKDSEDNTFESSHDSWAKLEEDETLKSLFQRAELKLEVIDLAGRLQINSLAKSNEVDDKVALRSQEILRNLLNSGEFAIENEDHADEIVDSIVDWLDDGDTEEDLGAENSYYLSLQPPHEARNGPIEDINELQLVKGIRNQEDLWNGTKDTAALVDYLTVHGNDGKININTADTLLLLALSNDIDKDLAEKMIDYRTDENKKDSLEKTDWYKSVNEWPLHVELEKDGITTTSSYFRIEAVGKVYEMEKRMVAIVERDDNGDVILLSKRVIR